VSRDGRGGADPRNHARTIIELNLVAGVLAHAD
jgi:hypothetical protein